MERDGVLQVQNNIFTHNSAQSGGGIWSEGIDSVPVIQDNTFYSNTAVTAGGMLYIWDGSPIIRSNLVVSNSAGEEGGGIYGDDTAVLDYNDFWGNAGGNYSNISPGVHDISANPLLVDPENSDFHLSPSSPCIDAGDPSNFPPTDFEGDPRPNGPAPDIGADDFYVTGGVRWRGVEGFYIPYLL